jgi:hypothetical protein
MGVFLDEPVSHEFQMNHVVSGTFRMKSQAKRTSELVYDQRM